MGKAFKCKKCGGYVRWRILPSGKFCPEELDGSDHWDRCRELWIQNMSAEDRSKMERRDQEMRQPRTTQRTSSGPLYNNPDIPPWDESLGEYRELRSDEA